MLAQHYPQILQLHVGCVALSGALFLLRGLARLNGSPLAQHAFLRRLSYLIDTALLTAAVLLTLIIRQYPLAQSWLTVKVGLLLVYIVLGSLALKRARTQGVRVLAFIAALATYGCIVGVALTHHPAGIFSLLGALDPPTPPGLDAAWLQPLKGAAGTCQPPSGSMGSGYPAGDIPRSRDARA